MEPKTRVRRHRLYYPSYVFAENTLRAFNFWGHPLIRVGETFLSNCVVDGAFAVVQRASTPPTGAYRSPAVETREKSIGPKRPSSLPDLPLIISPPLIPRRMNILLTDRTEGIATGPIFRAAPAPRPCARTYALPGNRSRPRYVCGKRNVRTTDEYRGITRASGSG